MFKLSLWLIKRRLSAATMARDIYGRRKWKGVIFFFYVCKCLIYMYSNIGLGVIFKEKLHKYLKSEFLYIYIYILFLIIKKNIITINPHLIVIQILKFFYT